jgi:hypothetical protein
MQSTALIANPTGDADMQAHLKVAFVSVLVCPDCVDIGHREIALEYSLNCAVFRAKRLLNTSNATTTIKQFVFVEDEPTLNLRRLQSDESPLTTFSADVNEAETVNRLNLLDREPA